MQLNGDLSTESISCLEPRHDVTQIQVYKDWAMATSSDLHQLQKLRRCHLVGNLGLMIWPPWHAAIL